MATVEAAAKYESRDAHDGDTANANFRSSSTSTNPRGIPLAPFVDDVEDYVSSRDDVETTLRNFQEMISYVTNATASLDT